MSSTEMSVIQPGHGPHPPLPRFAGDAAGLLTPGVLRGPRFRRAGSSPGDIWERAAARSCRRSSSSPIAVPPRPWRPASAWRCDSPACRCHDCSTPSAPTSWTSPTPIPVEYNGRDHLDPDRALRDLDREAYLTAAGWTVLRFGAYLVLQRPDVVAARVRARLVTAARAAGLPLEAVAA